jgi:hypothetical protein
MEPEQQPRATSCSPYKASTMAASPASECRRDSQVRTLKLRLVGIADLSFEVDELVGGDWWESRVRLPHRVWC